MRRPLRLALYGAGALAGLAALAVVAGLVVVQTPWFRNQVRERIVYEVENATGGRVQLGSFDFDWHTLTAGVRNFVIHGTEGPAEAPLFRADSIQVGLRIISVLEKRVDLESVVVRRPQANVIVYDDGHTNVPTPKVVRKRKRGTLETVLDLAIKRFHVVDGVVQVQMRRLPLNLFGENLRAQVFYQPSPARYRGGFTFRSLDVTAGQGKPLPVEVAANVVLSRDRLDVESVHLAASGSTFDLHGSLNHFAAPVGDFQYAAHVNLRELSGEIPLGPFRRVGTVALDGRAAVSGKTDYAVTGKLAAAGLALRERGIAIDDIRVDSGVAVRPGRIDFANLLVRALHGRFEGRAEIADLRDFRVDGTAQGFALHEATRIEGIHRMVWTGEASGPVRLAGAVRQGKLAALHLAAQLGITPVQGEDPVDGRVDLTYDHPTNVVSFGPSNLNTRFSRINFSGVLGNRMNATVETTNLDDAGPAIVMFTAGPPPLMPVKIQPTGSARFQGVVSGPLKNPTIQGHGSITNAVWEGRLFDRAEADVTVSRDGVVAQNARAARLAVHADGSMRVHFRDWKAGDAAPLDGTFTVRSSNLEDVLTAAQLKPGPELRGRAVTASVTLAGTLGNPQVSGRALVEDAVLSGQPLGRVQGYARYTGTQLDVPSAQIDSGASHLQFSARFDHRPGDWSQGRLRFQAGSAGIQLAQLKLVRDNVAEMEGRIETQLTGEVTVDRSGFRPGSLNGWVRLHGLAVGGEALGSLELTAATKGSSTGMKLEGRLAGSNVTGSADCTMSGDYPVQGRIDFTPLQFSTLYAKLRRTPSTEEPPFNGVVAGNLHFSGNTTNTGSWKGTLELPQVEIQPRSEYVNQPATASLALRNTGPVLVDLDPHGARIRQAHLRGKDTNLDVTGRVAFGVRNPWDVRVQGSLNLALLRDFDNQIYSSGAMAMDVSVRGALDRPEVYGRVDLRKASINLASFPNGIDNANGVIFLYRDRATIDSLTAETGGGKISVSGFISLAGVTTFHLQAKANDVRVRYPEGVSSTSDANLTFTGTLDRSVLAGDVTITRVGFNPRSDLGTILARTAQPAPTPAQPSRFRQGMRLDVRITTAPSARFETKLTKDIQADASLRLRGDSTRPILLGRIIISQGEVIFFGNKYTINTGQILFVNASKIEPTVSLDLETRARGIEVTLHVAGPVDKLNVSYRSDPPLQFSDIVALLATGREPGLQGYSGPQSSIGQNWQQGGASALVSQAIASPITGRLQRFFGVSRLKIDPQVTGLTTSNAAARVTLEQNITAYLTFTYITDLSRAQAQTIRIEWDFTKNWSGVAEREENGLFGIDFLYRKQVK